MDLKRMIAAFLSAVLICTATAGCSDSGGSSTAEDTSSVAGVKAPEFVSDPAAKITIENARFVADGKEVFMNGMNAPWQHWDDFGGSFDFEYWDKMFSTMKENGMNSTRVWITCSGDVGINIDDKGFVTGATDEHWQSLDVYFQLAQKYEIYVMATLISFDHFKDQNKNHMKWRTMVQNDEAIDSYVNNYVIPFCQRYDNNEYLWSIDLCNEPDWVVENEECGQLSWDAMGHYFSRCAAAIHENSYILVTVGFGMIKYNSDNYQGNYGSDEFFRSCYDCDKAYLDFYSTHYYKWQLASFGMPFRVTPEEFGLDTSKPIVLGECETTGVTGITTPVTLDEAYLWCYENGWSGILPWTTDGTEPYGDFINNIAPAAKKLSETINKAG